MVGRFGVGFVNYRFMDLNKIFVTVLGLGGIGFVYWFFFMQNETIVEATDSIDITVEGGYSPAVISIPLGKTTKINFFRKDPSNCLEEVVLSDFKIRKYLPLSQKVTIEIKPDKPGEYNFFCGMNMFHGKLIVVDPEQRERSNK